MVVWDNDTKSELWDGAAMFADPGDPVAIANTVNALAEDAVLRAELGQRARLRSSDFSIEAHRDAVLAAYRQAMRGSPRLTAAE